MLLRSIIAGALSASLALAQLASFPSPNYFRETFSRPTTRVELNSPARLPDFVVDGKLELSLRSYLELVMANNTDVAISKLTVETAQNAITRAFAPWDPLATASFTSQRSKTPANDALAGATTVSQLSQPARFNYQQTLPSGTNYSVTFLGVKSTSNSGFQNFNPLLTSSLAVNFTQPLLRNRGTYVNRLQLMAARSRLRVTEYNLRDTVLRLLSDAETAYWNVVEARENLRVQEATLESGLAFLKRSQRELELGAISPLDIYQPQQQYAQYEIAVTQARFNLQQVEDALRKQMGADMDPEIRKLPIVLTESVLPPTEESAVDPEAAVEAGLRNRPDLKSVNQSLDVDDLNIKSAKNQLRPDFSLIGAYTSQGRGGTFFQRQNVFTSDGSRSNIVTTTPGGLGDALDQLFGFGFPIYSFGVQLRLPIRNRGAAADLADAVVQKRRDTLQVRSVEEQIRLDILNAVTSVESSKASIKLATVARDFAQKRVDAEQKKYELGTGLIFLVVQAQIDLNNAESAVVRESVRYRRNLLNMLRRTGQLLDERGVVLQ